MYVPVCIIILSRTAKVLMQQEKEREILEASRLTVPPLDAFHKKSRPTLDAAPGYWILSQQEGLKDQPGFVQSVDEAKMLLKVDFSFGETKAVRVNFSEKGLKWCNPEAFASPRLPTDELIFKQMLSDDGKEAENITKTPASFSEHPTTDTIIKSQTENPEEKLGSLEGQDSDSDSDNRKDEKSRSPSSSPPPSPSLDNTDHSITPADDSSESGSINKDIFLPSKCPDVNTPLDGTIFMLVPPGDSDDDEDEIGKVLSLDFKNGMATVRFITSAPSAEEIKYDHEVEEVPFLAREIKWLKVKQCEEEEEGKE